LLIIRAEQMQRLALARQASFRDRLVLNVRRLFPDSTAKMSPSALSDCIRIALREATSHGIEADHDQLVFVYLCARLDWNLASHPWIAAALDNPAISTDPGRRVHFVAAECARRLIVARRNEQMREEFFRQESEEHGEYFTSAATGR
jgi:hypothetical protein